MSQSTQAASEFTNVVRPPWWRRGALASQSAYVLAALVVLVAGIWIIAPVFMTLRNLGNIATNLADVELAWKLILEAADEVLKK